MIDEVMNQIERAKEEIKKETIIRNIKFELSKFLSDNMIATICEIVRKEL